MERAMTTFLRVLKMLVAVVLATGVASVPACATMGGGGMKYLVDPVFDRPNSTAM